MTSAVDETMCQLTPEDYERLEVVYNYRSRKHISNIFVSKHSLIRSRGVLEALSAIGCLGRSRPVPGTKEDSIDTYHAHPWNDLGSLIFKRILVSLEVAAANKPELYPIKN